MPDCPVRNPDMDLVNAPDTPFTTLISCGHVLRGGARPCAPFPDLPCYQALGPWGEPDAGLPWFRIGQAEGTHGIDERTPLPHAAAEPLPDILRRTGWLQLVVGSDHDSLALALAIATYARGRGIRVTALLAGRPGQPFFQRASLLHCADYVCECPPGLDPLLAAQALWSSVGSPRQGGGAFADLTRQLAGPGRLAWSPLPERGDNRLETMLAALPPLDARRSLWAVLVGPQTLCPPDGALAGNLLRRHCPTGTAVIATLPVAGSLPEGLFVFSA